MGKSQRVSATQELAIVRLVNECRELGDDAVAWQTRFVEGLRRMTDAMVVTAGPLPGIGEYAATSVDLGWPSEEVREWWHEWSLDPANLAQHPGTWRFLHEPDDNLTRTRRQLVADREWHSNPFVNEHLKPDGMEEAILGRVTVPGVVVYTTVAMRAENGRPYNSRNGNLVALLHAELRPHLGRSLLVSTQPNVSGLSPRLRQVLDCLLDGDSEKATALRLKIHPTTVHDHVKRLYRHFGVNSRAELLAYFLRRYRRTEGQS